MKLITLCNYLKKHNLHILYKINKNIANLMVPLVLTLKFQKDYFMVGMKYLLV